MKRALNTVRWFQSKVYIALFSMLSIVMIGILGFRFISEYTWIDAIYMTVITVTTVGFGEVVPLDDTSKIFTVFLIVTSITIYIYAVTIFSEYIANGSIFKKMKMKKVEKQIKHLKNHTIIVGYGRNGRQAALKLKKSEREYLVIENDANIVKQLEEEGELTIHGDATDDEMLIKAGIDHANSIILALPSDADNLFISISAKQQNANVLVINLI